jgi:DNA polymerase III alpha subunit
VKFDFLGLRTLTIIDWALKIINRNRSGRDEDPLDIDRIPLDDDRPSSCCAPPRPLPCSSWNPGACAS